MNVAVDLAGQSFCGRQFVEQSPEVIRRVRQLRDEDFVTVTHTRAGLYAVKGDGHLCTVWQCAKLALQADCHLRCPLFF